MIKKIERHGGWGGPTKYNPEIDTLDFLTGDGLEKVRSQPWSEPLGQCLKVTENVV